MRGSPYEPAHSASAAHRLLTVCDLGAYLDVPVRTVDTWRHRSKAPRGFRVGRYLRFRWTDVELWLADLDPGDGD